MPSERFRMIQAMNEGARIPGASPTINVDPSNFVPAPYVLAAETAKAGQRRSTRIRRAAPPRTDGEQASPRVLSIRESIRQQLSYSAVGYEAILSSLNNPLTQKGRFRSFRKQSPVVAKRHPVATASALEREFDRWFTDEKLERVRAAEKADPRLNLGLLATPNVVADWREINLAAQRFTVGGGYGAKNLVNDRALRENTPEALSGTKPENGNSAQFSFWPFEQAIELAVTITEMARRLEANPNLKLPSVLDAVTNWYTLRSRQERLDMMRSTYVAHFDLEPFKGDIISGETPVSYASGNHSPVIAGSIGNLASGTHILIK